MRLLTAFIFLITLNIYAQTELDKSTDHDYFVKVDRCVSKSSGLDCKISRIKASLPSWHHKSKMTMLSITKGKKQTYDIKVTNRQKVYEFKGLKLKPNDIDVVMGEFDHFNKKAYPFTYSLMRTEPTFIGGIYSTILKKNKKVADGKIFISIHEENIDQPISLSFHWLAATPNQDGIYVGPFIEEEIRFNFTSDI